MRLIAYSKNTSIVLVSTLSETRCLWLSLLSSLFYIVVNNEALMTPAINLAKKAKIFHLIHEYQHDSNAISFGMEAVEKLNLAPEKVFKTLVVSLDNKSLAVAVLPVAEKLSMKLIAKAAGAKKAEMANPLDVQRATGYVLGGVSPLGQKKRLTTIIDSTAQNQQTIFVSAGRRGLEIELAPNDLIKLLTAKFAAICA